MSDPQPHGWTCAATVGSGPKTVSGREPRSECRKGPLSRATADHDTCQSPCSIPPWK